jgi:hypothetical protein
MIVPGHVHGLRAGGAQGGDQPLRARAIRLGEEHHVEPAAGEPRHVRRLHVERDGAGPWRPQEDGVHAEAAQEIVRDEAVQARAAALPPAVHDPADGEPMGRPSPPGEAAGKIEVSQDVRRPEQRRLDAVHPTADGVRRHTGETAMEPPSEAQSDLDQHCLLSTVLQVTLPPGRDRRDEGLRGYRTPLLPGL